MPKKSSKSSSRKRSSTRKKTSKKRSSTGRKAAKRRSSTGRKAAKRRSSTGKKTSKKRSSSRKKTSKRGSRKLKKGEAYCVRCRKPCKVTGVKYVKKRTGNRVTHLLMGKCPQGDRVAKIVSKEEYEANK